VSGQLEAGFLDALADAIADRVAERLAARLADATPAASVPAVPVFLSLEQLADELERRFPAKAAKAWRRWLYDRTSRASRDNGWIPGARKAESRWWFRLEETLPWVEAGGPLEDGGT
jgi:hypothetical protein